jgi:hypothetical protein
VTSRSWRHSFAAWKLNLPIVPNAKDKQQLRAIEYSNLLIVKSSSVTGTTTLPDPMAVLVNGWEGEMVSRVKWPCTMISDYLRKQEDNMDKIPLRQRLLSDYKEGKAFSYFASKFLMEILYHQISPLSEYCFLKAKCTPSYAVHDDPHDVWVCIHKKTGAIYSAYCTCFAGYAYMYNTN